MWEVPGGRLLTSLEGHTDGVGSAQFSPDGTRVVTTSADKTAKVSEVPSGRLLTSLEAHTNGVRSAQFSPDGTRVVTASGDGTAKVWEVASGRLLTSLEAHTYGVYSAQFSPDGTRVVTVGNTIVRQNEDNTIMAWEDYTAKVWEVASGAPAGFPRGAH